MKYTFKKERLSELIKETNLTYADIAEKLNVTAQTVALWDTGLEEPTIMNIIDLAKIFGVKTEQFLLNAKVSSYEEPIPLSKAVMPLLATSCIAMLIFFFISFIFVKKSIVSLPFLIIPLILISFAFIIGIIFLLICKKYANKLWPKLVVIFSFLASLVFTIFSVNLTFLILGTVAELVFSCFFPFLFEKCENDKKLLKIYYPIVGISIFCSFLSIFLIFFALFSSALMMFSFVLIAIYKQNRVNTITYKSYKIETTRITKEEEQRKTLTTYKPALLPGQEDIVYKVPETPKKRIWVKEVLLYRYYLLFLPAIILTFFLHIILVGNNSNVASFTIPLISLMPFLSTVLFYVFKKGSNNVVTKWIMCSLFLSSLIPVIISIVLEIKLLDSSDILRIDILFYITLAIFAIDFIYRTFFFDYNDIYVAQIICVILYTTAVILYSVINLQHTSTTISIIVLLIIHTFMNIVLYPFKLGKEKIKK